MLICILACSLAFDAITFERSSYMKITLFQCSHNTLVSLFCCLVARSRRKRGNRQKPSIYRNPRCACAPRVNYDSCTKPHSPKTSNPAYLLLAFCYRPCCKLCSWTLENFHFRLIQFTKRYYHCMQVSSLTMILHLT